MHGFIKISHLQNIHKGMKKIVRKGKNICKKYNGLNQQCTLICYKGFYYPIIKEIQGWSTVQGWGH